MEEQINSEVTKRLNTFLPIDVFRGLTEFCKANALTGLGKFDYGVGLRILLMKAQYADMIFDIDKRLEQVENKQSQSTEVKQVYKDTYTVKTFADRTKLEDNKNE